MSKYKFLLKTLFITASIMFLFPFCKGESDTEPSIDLSYQDIAFPYTAASNTVFVETNMQWTASVSENWCTLSAVSGEKGNTGIKISVSANTAAAVRQATITITAGSLSKQISVKQQPSDYIGFSQSKFDIAATGTDFSVGITSTDANYSYSIKSDWIALKSMSEDKTSQVFTVSENNSILSRTGLITYQAGSYKDTVVVMQAGKNAYIAPDATGMSSPAKTLASKMYAGWNLGNTLEATGSETAWGNPMVTQTLIDSVKAAGFNAIRIPCAWDSHLDDPTTYKINDSWLARVKQVVDYCTKANMYAILNIHWDGGWLENNPTYAKQEEVNKKQKALWIQIAGYFRDVDEHLLFAGTNEVHVDYNAPSAENIAVQQSFNQTFIDAVRSTGGRNYYRNLVAQSYNTNIDYAVSYLQLPTDVVSNRMMVEVHYYDPWDFCGDESSSAKYFWGRPFSSLGISSWGQEDYVDQQFGKMKTNFVSKGFPVILGEYAPTRRSSLTGTTLTNHLASRAYYLQYVTAQAKNNGMVPFYWDNGGTGNNASGIFNRSMCTTFDRQALDGIKTGAANGMYPF